MLKVKHLSFGYSKTKILSHIDFSVDKGKNLAIIGESGLNYSGFIDPSFYE